MEIPVETLILLPGEFKWSPKKTAPKSRTANKARRQRIVLRQSTSSDSRFQFPTSR